MNCQCINGISEHVCSLGWAVVRRSDLGAFVNNLGLALPNYPKCPKSGRYSRIYGDDDV